MPEELQRALEALKSPPPTMSAQERGRRFEKWLKELFGAAGLEPRGVYRPRGEEIDGSFVMDGRVYLLEAKWPADGLPASSIYAFKGKVEGKLAGTIGIYVSMAGFSPDTVDTLARGKELNVILVDEEDIDVAADIGVDHVLRAKVRAAAETGAVYFPVRRRRATSKAEWNFSALGFMTDSGTAVPARVRGSIPVVVEGQRGRAIVARVAHQVLADIGASEDVGVDVVVAMGLRQTSAVAAALMDVGGSTPILVVDGDGEPEDARKAMLAGDQRLQGRHVDIVVAEPSLDIAWLGEKVLGESMLRRIREALAEPRLERLREEPSFARFEQLLQSRVKRYQLQS